MAWISYEKWNGVVIDRRIRVPLSEKTGLSAFGISYNPLTLRTGAIGTIVNILPENSPKPDFVKFQGDFGWTYGAIVNFARASNTESMWKAFKVGTMNDDENQVAIPRRILDRFEIEIV